MDNMIKLRMFYEKKGRAKYISHLDINRLLQRVLKRTGLPVWYTEGFNPHMYLTFALPLSLGYESEYECMDFRLTKERDFSELCHILNHSMPEGIRVKELAAPVCKASEIASADYSITIHSQLPPEDLQQRFSEFFNADKIEVVKHTKRGDRIVDIKPDIRILEEQRKGDSVVYNMRFPAGTEKNYNPSLLLDAFTARTGIDVECAVLRTCVYTKAGAAFR